MFSGLSTIEAYNTKTDEWFHVLPMSTRRSSVGVGVVSGECAAETSVAFKNKNDPCLNVCLSGILYAVGGYDGATRQCLSTVEAYNPKNNTWSYIAEMGTRRSGAGVCEHTHCRTLSNAGQCPPRHEVLPRVLLRCRRVKRLVVCRRGARRSAGEEELRSL